MQVMYTMHTVATSALPDTAFSSQVLASARAIFSDEQSYRRHIDVTDQANQEWP